MTGASKIPRAVLVGLILAIALDTAIQIFWKLAVTGVPSNASVYATVLGALSNRYFYIAMLAFGAQLVNWIRVLGQADLSFAQPFTALGYVTVLAVSRHSLQEEISAMKILGVLLIFVGVFFISRTPHRTGVAHAD
jgi:drug/metabolite transporter (DMT)-like permease